MHTAVQNDEKASMFIGTSYVHMGNGQANHAFWNLDVVVDMK